MTTRANVIYNSLTIAGTGTTSTAQTLYVSGKTTSEVIRSQKELTGTYAVTTQGGIGAIDPSVSTYATLLVSGSAGSSHMVLHDDVGNKVMEFKENGTMHLNGSNTNNIRIHATTNVVINNGERNILMGHDASDTTTDFHDSIALGTDSHAVILNAGLSGTVALGARTVQRPDSNGVIGIGANAGRMNSLRGESVVCVGRESGRNSVGHFSVGMGVFSIRSAGSTHIVAIGRGSGQGASAGGGVVGIGANVNFGNTGDLNTAIGDQCLINNDFFLGFSGVTAIGEETGNEQSGSSMVYFGRSVGQRASGEGSVLIGTSVGDFSRTERCVVVGRQTLGRELQGKDNVLMGSGSVGAMLGGDNNVLIGDSVGLYSTSYGRIEIGYQINNRVSNADTGGTQVYTFDGTDINVSTQAVTIAGHGLTVGRSYVMYYRQGTASNGLLDGTVHKFEVIDANTLRKYNNNNGAFDLFSNQNGTGHFFSLYKAKEDNTTIIYASDSATSQETGKNIIFNPTGGNQTGMTLGFALPLYANDIAAIADGNLESNSLYRANTSPNQVRIKP